METLKLLTIAIKHSGGLKFSPKNITKEKVSKVGRHKIKLQFTMPEATHPALVSQ
jgi:hypothetical protein